MRIKQRRQYEMVLRVRDFGRTHGHVFRKTSMAPAAFRSIDTAVDELASAAVAKVSAALSSRADAKRRARENLDRLLVSASQLARVLRAQGQTVPPFMLPASKCDLEALTVARHFARDAAALETHFSGHGMSSTMIAAATDAFARAISARGTGRADHTTALVRIRELLAGALLDVRRLDLIVANELAHDAVVTAVWKQTRRVGAVRAARSGGTSEGEQAADPAEAAERTEAPELAEVIPLVRQRVLIS